MSDDEQQTAEAIDPDELGDDPTGDFPPDHYVGATDQGSLDGAMDSVAERSEREMPEGRPGTHRQLPRVMAPNDVFADDESDLIGALGDGEDRSDDLSAEEAAMHVAGAPPFSEGDGYLDA